MISVGMRDNYGHYRPFSEFFVYEIEGCTGRLLNTQGVNNNPASVSFYKRNVGKIKTAHLVNSGDDLI